MDQLLYGSLDSIRIRLPDRFPHNREISIWSTSFYIHIMKFIDYKFLFHELEEIDIYLRTSPHIEINFSKERK